MHSPFHRQTVAVITAITLAVGLGACTDRNLDTVTDDGSPTTAPDSAATAVEQPGGATDVDGDDEDLDG